jgi:hypothetical protein
MRVSGHMGCPATPGRNVIPYASYRQPIKEYHVGSLCSHNWHSALIDSKVYPKNYNEFCTTKADYSNEL